MKLPAGMSQTATRVKVLSSEIVNVEEADSFYVLEGSISCAAIYGKVWITLLESEAVVWHRKEIIGNWETRAVSA